MNRAPPRPAAGRGEIGRRSETSFALWAREEDDLDTLRALTDDQLRRLAQAVLAMFALLVLTVLGTGTTLHLLSTRTDSVVARQLPLPEPVRLAADAITVAAPTDEQAAPASGVTGTIALPTLPVPVAVADRIVAGESGIVAARPFSFGSASAVDRGRALQCLAAAIYYEAASEPDAGQQAVAQVVLNRVRHTAFPSTVCGVVYQGSERAGCQFSFACDGAMARAPSRDGWARATQVAALALAGRVYRPVGLATHYHTYAVTPAWNRSLVMTGVVGAHFFHRWKGYFGTAAAFSQRYLGGEPVPGPHTPFTVAAPVVTTSAPPVITVDPAALVKAARATVTAPATIMPAYRDSGTPVVTTSRTADDDPDSQILPQWRDSGKPLQP